MPAGSEVEEVVVASSGTQSSAFGVGGYERGSVQLSSALTGVTLSFEVSNDSGVTWDAARTAAGAVIADQTVAADQIHNIPSEVFSSRQARCIVAAQAAARTFKVHLTGP